MRLTVVLPWRGLARQFLRIAVDNGNSRKPSDSFLQIGRVAASRCPLAECLFQDIRLNINWQVRGEMDRQGHRIAGSSVDLNQFSILADSQ